MVKVVKRWKMLSRVYKVLEKWEKKCQIGRYRGKGIFFWKFVNLFLKSLNFRENLDTVGNIQHCWMRTQVTIWPINRELENFARWEAGWTNWGILCSF